MGEPSGEKSWDEILRQAIYKYPEQVSFPNTIENLDIFVNQELEKFEKRAFQIMAERKDRVRTVLREVLHRYLSLCCFIAEQVTFEVIDQGMQAAYDMIRKSLSAREQSLFKTSCLKNPNYLNRIIFCDPSPIFISFRHIVAKIYKRVGIEKALPLFDSSFLGNMFVRYVNFYPTWLRLVQDEEREKKRQKRRRERGEIRYDPSRDRDIPYGSEYRADSLTRASIELSQRYGKKEAKESRKHPRKTKKGRVLPFLTDFQREIFGLKAQGKLGKEVAQLFGCAPSTISKEQKKAHQILHQSWEKEVWGPLVRSGRRTIKRVYGKLSPTEKPVFKDVYLAHIREAIRQTCKGAGFNPEEIEKDFIPPLPVKITVPSWQLMDPPPSLLISARL